MLGPLDREEPFIEGERLGLELREGAMLGLRSPRPDDPIEDGKLDRERLGEDRSTRPESPEGKLLLERDRTAGEDPRSPPEEEGELRSTRLEDRC